MWHVLETFRTGVGQDFVFSSATAGDTLASDVASGMTFAVFWLLWIYVVGKSIGRYFTVDELIDRYGGAQITVLRSFMDDEAGVDFGGPVKPDARWRQIRLEPGISCPPTFGLVVAISGDARTIDQRWRMGRRAASAATLPWYRHPLEADPGTPNKCRRDGPNVGWGARWSMPLRSIRITLLHMSRAGSRFCSG